jgi:hypothetical protein
MVAASLARPVRGVRVRSRKTWGNCVPDFGYAELDFEPLADGQPCQGEYACTPTAPDDPEQWQRYLTALTAGAVTELAASGDTADLNRTADPVAARIVVRAITFHPVDSCEAVFTGLGALAAREALRCIAEDREPRPVTERIDCYPR